MQNEAIYLMQQYKEQAEELYAQVELINRLLDEYERTIETLQRLSEISDLDTLVPIGGNSFLYGNLVKKDSVIVNVGRGILIEKPINAALDVINKKVVDLKKSQDSLIKTINDIQMKMEDLSKKLSEQNVQVPKKEN